MTSGTLPRPLGTASWILGAPNLWEQRHGSQEHPASGNSADPAESQPVPAPSSLAAFAVPSRNWVSQVWMSPRHLVSPPVVAPWGLLGLGSPSPPPRLPQGPGVPVRGESHGVGGRQQSRPLGSSLRFQPGPGALRAAFPLPKHPKPLISAWGGAGPPPHLSQHKVWVSPAILSSGIPGLGEGVSVLQGSGFPGAGLGGLLVLSPLPKNLGLFMERGAS